MAQARDPIVILGGGRAAASLIDSYRAAGGEELIVLVGREPHPPYNRPPLSKGVLRGEMDDSGPLIHSPTELEDMLVDARLGSEATGVDAKARRVSLSDGSELEYGTLVIATGARPRLLDVEGAELPDVTTLRTLDDAVSLRERAQASRKAIVVGGSFIGSEVAASLRLVGVDVALVEQGERLVPALASDEISDQVADLYRERGIEIHLDAQLEAFEANGKLLTGARLASGERLEGFLAVVGVGVEPNTGFLEGSGIELDDGVVVDDHLRTSVAGVYAIGDVASFDDLVSGRRRRIEHWSNADAHGEYLGGLLAGSRRAFEKVPAFFTKLFDVQLQLLGDTKDADEVLVRGSLAEHSLVALYLREERIAAATLVGQTEDTARDLAGLIRERAQLTDRSSVANLDVRAPALFG